MFLIPAQRALTEKLNKFSDDYNTVIGEERVRVYESNRYWDYMMGFVEGDFTKDDIVLDVGGGFSHFMVYLAPYIKAGIIIDNVSFTWPVPTFWDWYMTLFDYQSFKDGKISVMLWDATNLPFPNNFFDKVVSFSALEHFGRHNDTQAALEIRRVLKPNGVFLGTVDFNMVTEYPTVDGDPYAYTYDSFFNRIVYPSELKFAERFQPFQDNSGRTDYVSTLFFKLVK